MQAPPDAVIGDGDLRLIASGAHERLYEVLGAHPRAREGEAGTAFAVWAPQARHVWLTLDGLAAPLPMRIRDAGVWELFAPGIGPGATYAYEVLGADGRRRRKVDPLGFVQQLSPERASRTWDLDAFTWTDAAWLADRARRDPHRSPMATYEVHLGSWRRHADGSWLTYRQAAELLAEHCGRHGFTHVELMPIAEHPFDGSWGYQVTGYYAPTARYGTPDDLAAMIDTLHAAGIGVIVDWVPAHFPRDEWALSRFDGTAQYEHGDPRRGEHPDWQTLVFDYGRPEVRNFLVANALFWLDRYHVDGLRVDAVASMLHLDYSRGPGQWTPNVHGGKENLEAIALLREVNRAVQARHPGAVTIAEESTAFPGVSRGVERGGLGFTFKWDMGWMHDTLEYFRAEPSRRSRLHARVTFRGLYKDTEHFVLPLSHDEVVYAKGSLLGKMPGSEAERFANLRALLVDQWTQPGKKLLFMGSELAPLSEWDHDAQLPWEIASEPMRAAFGRFVVDLGRLYRDTPALWERDHDPDGFAWLEADDAASSVFAWLRRDAAGGVVVVVVNLGPVAQQAYRLGLPAAVDWREALNSDAASYGGSGLGNVGRIVVADEGWRGQPASAELTLPALSGIVLRPDR